MTTPSAITLLPPTGTPGGSIPTTSSASGSAPTASSTPDGSRPSGLFSKTGSPALVLAFLAIGIFAGGLLSMLFLRHIRILRLMRQRQMAIAAEAVSADATEPLAMGRRARRHKPLGEKPKLWEYTHGSGRRSRKGWDGFVPIAVSSVQPLKISLPEIQPIARPPRSTYRRRLDSVGRWVKGLASRTPAPPHPPPSSAAGALHVTVAVAMPSQRRPRAGERLDVPVYELGFMDVPWTMESFEKLTPSPPPPETAPSAPL